MSGNLAEYLDKLRIKDRVALFAHLNLCCTQLLRYVLTKQDSPPPRPGRRQHDPCPNRTHDRRYPHDEVDTGFGLSTETHFKIEAYNFLDKEGANLLSYEYISQQTDESLIT